MRLIQFQSVEEMYELCPYFTNDGTVGLFSNDNDDIYHSTYGALTESWQKFIEPSCLAEYIQSHSDVKILDICYGIGYNTKAALQTFLEIQKKNKFRKKNKKNSKVFALTNAAIDTDNILQENNTSFKQKFSKNYYNNTQCIEKEYSDNITGVQDKKNQAKTSNDKMPSLKKYNILIDAVDTDEKLMTLSPFIALGCNNKMFFAKCIKKVFSAFERSNKILQIKKINQNDFSPLPKNYKISKSIPIIILKSIMDNQKDIFKKFILDEIASENKYTMFLSKFMLNFLKFYQNLGSNHKESHNKSSFLHNIYYQYISGSYKMAKKYLKNANIKLNLHNDDARIFIKQTNNKYNFIFLDAFTPSKCPALWTLQFFKELYDKLEDDGMILTYSNSAAVRNALLQNGFNVGKTYDEKSNKFIGTVAAKNKNLIEYVLDKKDIALINSKAGICYKDENLNLDNDTIIKNRDIEVEQSKLISSSKALKGYKCKIITT